VGSAAARIQAYLDANPGPAHPADLVAALGLSRATVCRHIPPERRAPHRYTGRKITIHPDDLTRPAAWVARRYRCCLRTVRRRQAEENP
jgi:hypothetical protein